jgi:hypothetical protein
MVFYKIRERFAQQSKILPSAYIPSVSTCSLLFKISNHIAFHFSYIIWLHGKHCDSFVTQFLLTESITVFYILNIKTFLSFLFTSFRPFAHIEHSVLIFQMHDYLEIKMFFLRYTNKNVDIKFSVHNTFLE